MGLLFPFSSLYTTFLFVLLLLSLQKHSSKSIASHDLIHKSCKKVAKSDPNLSYTFCVTTLEANPKSKNATSLKELTLVAIELTISNATKIHLNISKLLKQSQYSKANPHAEQCLKDCLRFYSDAISSLRDAKRDFLAKNLARANLEISSAMDVPSACEEGFGERKGQVSPLTHQNNVFFQWTVVSIAFTNMLARQI